MCASPRWIHHVSSEMLGGLARRRAGYGLPLGYSVCQMDRERRSGIASGMNTPEKCDPPSDILSIPTCRSKCATMLRSIPARTRMV